MAIMGSVIVAAFFLGLMVFSVLRSRGDPSLVQTAILKIFLRHAQQTLMAASFPLQWPDVILDMFNSFSAVSSIGDQTFSVECIVHSTPPSIGSMFMTQSIFMICELAAGGSVAEIARNSTTAPINHPSKDVIPPLIFISLLLFWYSYAVYEGGGADPLGVKSSKKILRQRRATAVAKVAGGNQRSGGGREQRRPTVNERRRTRIGIKEGEFKTTTNTRIFVSCLVVATFIHTTMTSMTFRLFKCTKPMGDKGNQRLLLEHDLNIECGSSDHLFWLGTIGVPSLLIYVMGIPATAFGLLYLYHADLKVQRVRSMLGFLYSDYVSLNGGVKVRRNCKTTVKTHAEFLFGRAGCAGDPHPPPTPSPHPPHTHTPRV